MYTFAGMHVPELTAYGLVPIKCLDRGLIEAQWEIILRLIVL